MILFAPARRTIIANAGAIAITMASSALLGYPYWWLAARQFSPTAGGFAAAVISAMSLLGTLGVLGLGTLVISELPRRRGRELNLIVTAAASATVVAMVLGGVFALGGSLVSPQFAPLGDPPVLMLFAAGTGLTATGLVLDQAFIGLLRGRLQISRYLLFGVSKLVALGIMATALPSRDGLVICVSWVTGAVISVAPLGWLFFDRAAVAGAVVPDLRLLRGQGRAALSHHVLNTGLQFPSLALPILVTGLLSATDNAYFYAAWTIANMIFLICGALTAVLYAMGVREPSAVAGYTRFTLGFGLCCGVAGGAVLLSISHQLLGALFGPSYAEHAAPVLSVLIFAALPVAVIDHYVALCRIRGRALSASRLVIAGGVLQLGMAAVGARTGGLVDLCLGWLFGLTLQAVFMAPLVYRTIAAIEPLPGMAEGTALLIEEAA